MAGYSPIQISGNTTGLVQSRVEFLIPDDAYPVLENAFVWRERLKRKQGYKYIGRLRRELTNFALPFPTGGALYQNDVLASFRITGEPNAQLQPGVVITFDQGLGNETIFEDITPGVLTNTNGGPFTISFGSISYSSGVVTLLFTSIPGVGVPVVATFAYYPTLPVMGLRTRDIVSINNEEYIQFDTKYAYRFVNDFIEYIPGTTWTGTDSDFFWSTNYWVDPTTGLKVFWVTNYSGKLGDPIRYTDGLTWNDFAPQIDAAGNLLNQSLCIIPFRSRLVMFNTLEGPALATSTIFTNKIRWSAIGNPFLPDAWRDDIRGQGGFLDIPTNEDIISVGFVRDNLVIYCERSTWQLRYTGRSIAPFQIEKVNSELGAESTFSAVQFDTSLVGVGDKGIVECDSFKSNRIDVKIPDLVFSFNNDNDGVKRVHGIRDFIQKLAYWTYPYSPGSATSGNKFPNRRLVYNYENDSWAIFTDSLTTLGNFQPVNSQRWMDITAPWRDQNWSWSTKFSKEPDIIGGNQQGYILSLDYQVTNQKSLTIMDITGDVSDPQLPVVIRSVDHNLATGQVIKIAGIVGDVAFLSINDGIYQVTVIDKDTFKISTYNTTSMQFSDFVYVNVGIYLGGGEISIRDGFNITSKKFNFLSDGQNIQLGFIDVLLNNTSNGAISLYVYLDYNDSTPVNTRGENIDPQTNQPDPFFNVTVPTTRVSGLVSSKNWQRVFCAARGDFITLQWTLSLAQLAGPEQESDVEIDSQILWVRKAGRQLSNGV